MAVVAFCRLLTLLVALALATPAAAKPIVEAAAPDGLGGGQPRPTATVDTGRLAGTSTSIPLASPPSSDSDSEVESTSTARDVSQFLGIRFASPPLRFEPPQPARPWTDVYDASKYRATCIQQFSDPEGRGKLIMQWLNNPPPPTPEDEDCLFLNVFAPANAANASKAVMFWIYGGSFSFGSGALPLYDGSSFAANQDVVLVTFNYRTNIFGFPGVPDRPREQQNLGFMDQRLALDWVRRNIHVFGGDPDRITVFGESAGGESVDALITAPPQPVPFVAAIMQSASTSGPEGDGESAKSWRQVVSAANCAQPNGLDCLRAVPAQFLNKIAEENSLTFYPTHDGGVTWADRPRKQRLRSKPGDDDDIARVPLLLGTNADEGSLYVQGNYDVEGYLNNVLSPATPVSTLISPSGDRNAQLTKLYTEVALQCPAATTAQDSKQAGVPTYRYFYDASFPNTEIFPGAGAYHSSEIATIFGTFPSAGSTPFQRRLGSFMQKAWADFAKNPANGPGWPQLPDVAVLGDGATPGESDDGRRLIIIEPESSVDPNCRFYRLLYTVLSPFY